MNHEHDCNEPDGPTQPWPDDPESGWPVVGQEVSQALQLELRQWCREIWVGATGTGPLDTLCEWAPLHTACRRLAAGDGIPSQVLDFCARMREAGVDWNDVIAPQQVVPLSLLFTYAILRAIEDPTVESKQLTTALSQFEALVKTGPYPHKDKAEALILAHLAKCVGHDQSHHGAIIRRYFGEIYPDFLANATAPRPDGLGNAVRDDLCYDKNTEKAPAALPGLEESFYCRQWRFGLLIEPMFLWARFQETQGDTANEEVDWDERLLDFVERENLPRFKPCESCTLDQDGWGYALALVSAMKAGREDLARQWLQKLETLPRAHPRWLLAAGIRSYSLARLGEQAAARQLLELADEEQTTANPGISPWSRMWFYHYAAKALDRLAYDDQTVVQRRDQAALYRRQAMDLARGFDDSRKSQFQLIMQGKGVHRCQKVVARSSHGCVVLPVIHCASAEQAVENAGIAVRAGAEGVFLINHGISSARLFDIVPEVRDAFPDLWIGINCLGMPPLDVLQRVTPEVDGVWVDNARIRQLREGDGDGTAQGRLREAQGIRDQQTDSGWHGLYFGGVAFKYQPEATDLKSLCATARGYMDVLTTSGPGTGEPPSVEKIRQIRGAIGDFPLAIASGVTAENAVELLPLVDFMLVASGISRDFHELDPDLTQRLLEVARTGYPSSSGLT